MLEEERFAVISRRVQRGDASWGALTKDEQQEIDEVIRLWRDTAKHGHVNVYSSL
jgi:hypothetical protein